VDSIGMSAVEEFLSL